MDFAATAVHWSNFFLLTAGAAATLTGLMFVAITFGSSLATRDSVETTRAFVDPVFAHFVHVLLLGSVAVIPTMGHRLFGAAVGLLALLRSTRMVSVTRHLRLAHQRNGDLVLQDWMVNLILPCVAYLAFFITAGAFYSGRAWAFDCLAAVMLVQLSLGLIGAWELLLWMAVAINDRRKE